MAKTKELTIADKLDQLLNLQKIHSKIDQIHTLKGELPMEVSDLEDEIEGLKLRITKASADITNKEEEINSRKNAIKDAKDLVLKYEKQLDNVKNNREYDALTKEIEMQNLDVQLHEKRIKDANFETEKGKEIIVEIQSRLDSKTQNLVAKKAELDHIIQDTDKEENDLVEKAEKISSKIEERLLNAYNRTRKSYKNGLAVVYVERNACGGCFGNVPPQTQVEIKQKKKIVLCEHCGRILVDVNSLED
jgi:predicted  nucleic acid-binding Zn-ribbon protein